MGTAERIRNNPEDKERNRTTELWEDGTLFHNFDRFPQNQPGMDRLDSILKRGLIPPGLDRERSAASDLNIEVDDKDYDKVIFLHKFSTVSWVYIPTRENTLSVFLDKNIPILTPREMGEKWPVTCLDEVYHKGIISPKHFSGIAASSDLDSILSTFGKRLQKLGIPLYKMTGEVFWPGN